MVSKQDGVSPRTASELEMKLGLGKKFSEVMGYAADAQKAAEMAQEAADKANAAYEGLDQEAIFNILTNNGKEQGIYRGENGQIYINASYIMSGIIDAAVVKVVNLIANTVVSQKVKNDEIEDDYEDPEEKLEIGSAGLTLENGRGRAFVLRQVRQDNLGDISYIPFARFENLIDDPLAQDQPAYYQSGEYSATGFYVGGSKDEPAMKVTAEREHGAARGTVKIALPSQKGDITLDLNVYWKPNNDGTYSLIGVE